MVIAYPETRRGARRMPRGFFEIGVVNGKSCENIGTLWRSAFQLGATGIFTVGRRYDRHPTDTLNATKHVPYRAFADWEAFEAARPIDCELVAIEMGGTDLATFSHPERATYLLGAEDNGVPKSVLQRCQHVVSIDSVRTASFNVAVAGSLVMYHRLTQRRR